VTTNVRREANRSQSSEYRSRGSVIVEERHRPVYNSRAGERFHDVDQASGTAADANTFEVHEAEVVS